MVNKNTLSKQPASVMRDMANKAVIEQFEKSIPEVFETIFAYARDGKFSCEYRNSNPNVIVKLAQYLVSDDYGYVIGDTANPHAISINW